MRQRVLTALAMGLVGLPAVVSGGFFYFLVVSVLLAGAAWEYVRLFHIVNYEPQPIIVIGGVFLIAFARAFFVEAAVPALVFLIMGALTFHLIAFERGRDKAALDFCVTVGALVYLGWIGAYLLDLRNLPEGGWWLMLVLPCVWFADTGAYYIGSAYGRHKMSPRLSPKKSWEGYFAGIVLAVCGGAFLTYAYTAWGGLTGEIVLWQGAVLGLMIGALAPLGDFGESMFKRQSSIKDSSNVFPGHGGFFDRIDSWLWAAVIGCYYIQWLVLK